MRKIKGPFRRLASFTAEDRLIIETIDIPPPNAFPFVGEVLIDTNNGEGIILSGRVEKIILNHSAVKITVTEFSQTPTTITTTCRYDQLVSITVFHEKEITKAHFRDKRKKKTHIEMSLLSEDNQNC